MDDLNFVIRILNCSEIDKLIDLWNNSSLPIKPEGRDTKDNLKNQIRIANNRFFVAELDHQLIGAVIASHNGRKGWINRLAVLPEFRGKGIAASLIERSERFFLSHNIKIFACLIEDWNDISMNFFHKKDYISHRDIIYFTKKIDQEV